MSESGAVIKDDKFEDSISSEDERSIKGSLK